MTDYTLIRSRRKTVSLQVGSDGQAVVRAPLHMSEARIESFVAAHEAWLKEAQEQQRARLLRHPEPTEEQALLWRKKAYCVLPERTAYWSRLTGLVPSAVHITSAKRRFGSCSSKGVICYTWRLMDYPMEAIDLVIVHELCHLRHPNHGKEFYRLLESILPDWKERTALLKN